jgi:hypothetical protein
MAVARDDHRSAGCRECDEIVVAWIGRADGGRLRRIFEQLCPAAEQLDQFSRVGRPDASAKLGVGEDAFELGQQLRGGDQLVGTVKPRAKHSRGGAARCQNC